MTGKKLGFGIPVPSSIIVRDCTTDDRRPFERPFRCQKATGENNVDFAVNAFTGRILICAAGLRPVPHQNLSPKLNRKNKNLISKCGGQKIDS